MQETLLGWSHSSNSVPGNCGTARTSVGTDLCAAKMRESPGLDAHAAPKLAVHLEPRRGPLRWKLETPAYGIPLSTSMNA